MNIFIQHSHKGFSYPVYYGNLKDWKFRNFLWSQKSTFAIDQYVLKWAFLQKYPVKSNQTSGIISRDITFYCFKALMWYLEGDPSLRYRYKVHSLYGSFGPAKNYFVIKSFFLSLYIAQLMHKYGSVDMERYICLF
jgi:hypothetical protein